MGNPCGEDLNYIDCPATEVANSNYSATGSITGDSSGTELTITCDHGWSANGSSLIYSCGHDGQWINPTQCEPVTCADYFIENSNVAGTGSITYPNSVQKRCDLGFEAWDVSSYNESEHTSLGTGRNFTLTCGYATCSDFNGLGETSCVNAGCTYVSSTECSGTHSTIGLIDGMTALHIQNQRPDIECKSHQVLASEYNQLINTVLQGF